MRCELERRAMALQGAVDFRGHSHNVGAELRRADLLVRPSLTEGMPLTVLEAMASGVCVVASDIAGNRDLIKDGENGVLVPVKQSQALMLAIRSLLQEPDRRRRLADAGHATAQQYSWDRTVAGTAAALKKALQTDAAMARSYGSHATGTRSRSNARAAARIASPASADPFATSWATARCENSMRS